MGTFSNCYRIFNFIFMGNFKMVDAEVEKTAYEFKRSELFGSCFRVDAIYAQASYIFDTFSHNPKCKVGRGTDFRNYFSSVVSVLDSDEKFILFVCLVEIYSFRADKMP